MARSIAAIGEARIPDAGPPGDFSPVGAEKYVTARAR